ncbi:uncharacterized protein LOC111631177 [Centruroides sculpturatus]|uniref:uncharacterized protein LOC111631177 n=1 Tax=Centruroides sculpturatus TaxID=218467 RepID=UPI000C6E4978|nr:uncharacterized protein LOC111631177 [Centruroides sculpturatus]
MRYRVVYPIPTQLGYSKYNGTWTGITKQVVNQEADIAFVPTGITYDLFSAIQFSSTLGLSENIFIIRAPNKASDWNSLMKPFALDIWIAVFSTVLIFGLSLHLILKKDLIVEKNRKRWTRCRIFWDLFCTLLGQGLDIRNVKTFASRFMIEIWWLSIVVLLYGYSGGLKSFMACPLIESYPKNFYELGTFVRNGEYSCGTMKILNVWKAIETFLSRVNRLFEAGIVQKLLPKEIEEFNEESVFQALSVEDIKSLLLFVGIGILLFQIGVSNNSYVWRVAGITNAMFMRYDESKRQITGGKYFPFFKVIQEKLKFSYFVVKPIESILGYKDENGKWLGSTGQVANQRNIPPLYLLRKCVDNLVFP